MFGTLEIVSFVVAAAVFILAFVFGAPEIRRMRNETGDDSFLTALLSGDLFRKGY